MSNEKMNAAGRVLAAMQADPSPLIREWRWAELGTAAVAEDRRLSEALSWLIMHNKIRKTGSGKTSRYILSATALAEAPKKERAPIAVPEPIPDYIDPPRRVHRKKTHGHEVGVAACNALLEDVADAGLLARVPAEPAAYADGRDDAQATEPPAVVVRFVDAASAAVCPNCRTLGNTCDEDRCCLTCGTDLVVCTDAGGADALIGFLGEREAEHVNAASVATSTLRAERDEARASLDQAIADLDAAKKLAESWRHSEEKRCATIHEVDQANQDLGVRAAKLARDLEEAAEEVSRLATERDDANMQLARVERERDARPTLLEADRISRAPFFLVWSPTGPYSPRSRLASRESARSAADSMARKHTGEFFVLAAVDVRRVPVAVEAVDLLAETDSRAVPVPPPAEPVAATGDDDIPF